MGNGKWANMGGLLIIKDQSPDGSEDLEIQITRGSDGSLYMAQRGVHICFFALWGKGTAFSVGLVNLISHHGIRESKRKEERDEKESRSHLVASTNMPLAEEFSRLASLRATNNNISPLHTHTTPRYIFDMDILLR